MAAVHKTRLVQLTWIIQVVAAAAFLAAGVSKLIGAPTMVAVFDTIGVGQWFRIVTGFLETAGAAALLIPRFAAFGALLLAIIMAVAVAIHLAHIGGSAVPAAILLGLTATVAWVRRASFSELGPGSPQS